MPAVYQSYVASLVVTNSNLAAIAAESGYVWAVVDQNGRIALGIKPDGTLYAPKYSVTGISVSQLASDVLARLTAGNVGSQLQNMPDEQSAYPFAIVDQNGRIALAIDSAGHVQAITTISDGAITLSKLATSVQTVLPQSLGEESGAVFALVDSNGRAALTVAKDGSVSIAKFALPDGSITYAKLTAGIAQLLPQSVEIESGYALAVVDQDGRVAFGVDPTGKLVASNLNVQDMTSTVDVNDNFFIESFVDGSGKQQLRSISRSTSRVTVLTSSGSNFDPHLTDDDKVLYRSDASGPIAQVYRPAAGGVEYPVYPKLADGIVCWGDSLTAGAGSTGGQNMPWKLAQLLGVTVSNQGLGGQGSQGIAARQNGQPALLTVTNDQIPASGSVAITSLSTPLLTGSGSSPASATGILAGVAGTLSFNGSTYSFTRAASGSVVPCPPNTAFITDLGLQWSDNVQVLWLGRNTISNPSQVLSDTAACVAYIKNYAKRFVVLSVLNGGTGGSEYVGTTNYNKIKTINDALASTYGPQYVDVRSYLVQHGLTDAGIIPTSQDTADVAGDTVPQSLRVDTIHLITDAYSTVASQVFNKILDLGWT